MGIGSDDILAALRARHTIERGWLYAEEVECNPDRSWSDELKRSIYPIYNGGYWRRIDAYAMAIWASKRYARIAYEVKVSRSDFLREINDPSKRHWAVALSNQFFFVMPEGVADKAEIPEECGMMLYRKGKVRVYRQAPWRWIEEYPVGFVAYFARRLLTH